MFSKPIYSTVLTSEAADRLFSNIVSSGEPDSSFLATMRALLRKRLPQNETARLTVKSLYMSLESMESSSIQANINEMIPDGVKYPVASEYNILIVYNNVNSDAGAKMLEIIRANIGIGKRNMVNYSRCEDLRIFYARKLNALFYTDSTKRNIVIFMDKLELKQFHVLQMMLPKYLPTLFKDKPLTDDETALLKSTGNKSAVEYETIMGAFTKDLDIRSEAIRIKLSGFETAFERIRINEIKTEITGFQNDYDSHLSILRDLTLKIQNCQYTLAGLECVINGKSGDSELMEYFMCNKNLNLIRASGTLLEFVVHGYADVYDIEAFEQYVGNHGGYMYNNISSAVTKVQMEKLYRAIFSEGRYKLRICAAYTADMRTGLRAFQHYSFPAECITYLPNPHIQQYGCIGSYAGRFQEYMSKKDYVGAIEQAVVSARNLNFYDSAVMSILAHDLSHSVIKCIEKPDGMLVTPLEAIKEMEEIIICPDQ